MKEEEKRLFRELCNFKGKRGLDETHKKAFDDLTGYATPRVLGKLFFNRMQGVAYGELKKNGVLGKVNREFRSSLRSAYEMNVRKNKSFYECVQYLSKVMSGCTCKYAMLKGAMLCGLYPEGYRTSNDIDLLVLPEDITEVGNALTQAGFIQGYIRNDEFRSATRKEIIESRMMRGETVPYVKEVNFPEMKYLEVDINFSLDCKNDDGTVVRQMLERTQCVSVLGTEIVTLSQNDFFIHLCGHLYKEAARLPWVEMKRDMSLYKYCDIYMLLSQIRPSEVKEMFERAKMLDMEKICSFAILQTAALFNVNNESAISKASMILAWDGEMELLHQVNSPKDNTLFVYQEKDISERFFMDNRLENLVEIDEEPDNGFRNGGLL